MTVSRWRPHDDARKMYSRRLDPRGPHERTSASIRPRGAMASTARKSEEYAHARPQAPPKRPAVFFWPQRPFIPGRVIGAAPAKPGSKADQLKNTDVKLLEDQQDPFAGPGRRPKLSDNASATTNTLLSVASRCMQSNVDGTFSLNITNDADLARRCALFDFKAVDRGPAESVSGPRLCLLGQTFTTVTV